MFIDDPLLLLNDDLRACYPPRYLVDGARNHLPLLLNVGYPARREFSHLLLFWLDSYLAFSYKVVALSDLRRVSFLGQLRNSQVFRDLPINIPYAREPDLIRLLLLLGGCIRKVLVNV